MTPDTRKILDTIDEFLARHDEASAELAAVLSATRGPDNGEPNEKIATQIIRRLAFPLATYRPSDIINGTSFDTPQGVFVPRSYWASRNAEKVTAVDVFVPKQFGGIEHIDLYGTNHFACHVAQAAKVLGLEVNVIEK